MREKTQREIGVVVKKIDLVVMKFAFSQQGEDAQNRVVSSRVQKKGQNLS
jgi:hypothetical protein